MVLVSSNPTNLVLSGAFGFSFVKYTGHVILPFLAGAISVYPVLVFILYRSPRLIPPSLGLELSEEESGSQTLVDKNGAIFGSILLMITLPVLVGTSTVGVPVWEVTVPPAVIMLLRDTWHDWKHHRPVVPQRSREASPREYPLAVLSPSDSTHPTPDSVSTVVDRQESDSPTPPEVEDSTESSVHQLESSLVGKVSHATRKLEARYPTVSTIAHRLPISLVPFAFLIFILVQGLSTKGWVEVFAGWWHAWVTRTGTVGAVGGMGFVACMLCNVSAVNYLPG